MVTKPARSRDEGIVLSRDEGRILSEVDGHVRLTQLASCAGCAAKAGADVLAQVLVHLSELQNGHHPNLLVGLTAPDDATVYRLSDDQAVVLTVDFFAPLVDDAYQYGAIAAANALSDVYAMGGEAVLALNIAAFPADLPSRTVADILRGGADKVSEAGAIVAGGHTIIDAEPKYGLCVMGLVHPDRIQQRPIGRQIAFMGHFPAYFGVLVVVKVIAVGVEDAVPPEPVRLVDLEIKTDRSHASIPAG